jgi:hypothetical protein
MAIKSFINILLFLISNLIKGQNNIKEYIYIY